MMERRRIILAVVMAIVATVTVRADMVPASGPVIGCPPQSCECPEVQGAGALDVQPFVAVVLNLLPPGLPSGVQPSTEQRSESQPLNVLSDEQNSLSLCLYALFSLGLCKSAPWVKKVSFGILPGWYHDGGPFQVGQSVAISPDCLDSAWAYCFIQPVRRGEDTMPQYRRETVVSLWRKGQFTPAAIASRGPPHMP
jgi:hypothetical protein